MSNSIIKNKCIWVILLLNSTPNLYCQWQWLSPGYTTAGSYSESNEAVAVDANGAVYTAGTYFQVSATDFQISLKKYAPNGVTLCQVLYNNGTGNDIPEAGNDIAVSLTQDKVVVGGSQYGKPFLGFFHATTLNCSYINQIAFTGYGDITKIDLRGDAVWVIGNFSGTFSPGSGVTFVGNAFPNSNIFIAKYSMANNALLSAVHIKSPYLKAYDVKIDNFNNVFFTAGADQPVQFMNSSGGVAYTYVPSNANQEEVFAAKLDQNYKVLWVQHLAPSPGDNEGASRYPIVLVPGNTPTFIAGGLNDIKQGSFLQKRLASNGALLCQAAITQGKVITDITVGCGPTIFTTGSTISSSGNCNTTMFFDKYSFSDCSFVWSQNSNDCASGAALVSYGVGNVAVAGTFYTPTFTLGGISIAHPNQKGVFTGSYSDVEMILADALKPGSSCTTETPCVAGGLPRVYALNSIEITLNQKTHNFYNSTGTGLHYEIFDQPNGKGSTVASFDCNQKTVVYGNSKLTNGAVFSVRITKVDPPCAPRQRYDGNFTNGNFKGKECAAPVPKVKDN